MELKNEANVFKGQVDKVADKIVFGMNRENHIVNVSYTDNRQINCNIFLPPETDKIDNDILERRIKTVVDESLASYKQELSQKIQKTLKELHEEELASGMVAVSGDSVARNYVYITTGNNADIQIVGQG